MGDLRKRGIGGISSMLISIPGLAAFFCFTVIASVLHQALIAGFCLFVLLVCGLSRLWGFFSIRRVSIAVDTQTSISGARVGFAHTSGTFGHSAHMFAGDDAEVFFSIKNRKLLPLIWLELWLPMPRRACIMPSGDFEEADLSVREEDQWDGGTALRKRFSFIMGMDSLEWRSSWTARRRGIYRIDRLVLRSGDGFGLTQAQRVMAPPDAPAFIVYPEIRKVDIAHFLAVQWDSTGGKRGVMDDLTVMRGMRRYEEGDSFKRINWRMMALRRELNTNIYETITPKAIHFVFDGESFCQAAGDSTDSEGDMDFEHALSLTASLILRLAEAGVLCGLSLPRSRFMPHTDIAAASDPAEILTAMAGYDMLAERDDDKSLAAQRTVFKPSDFDRQGLARAAYRAGRLYYVARDAAGMRAGGLPRELDRTRLTLLTFLDASDDDSFALGVELMPIRAFQR